MDIEELSFYLPEIYDPDYCIYFAVKGKNSLHNNTQKLLLSITHNFNRFHFF